MESVALPLLKLAQLERPGKLREFGRFKSVQPKMLSLMSLQTHMIFSLLRKYRVFSRAFKQLFSIQEKHFKSSIKVAGMTHGIYSKYFEVRQ